MSSSYKGSIDPNHCPCLSPLHFLPLCSYRNWGGGADLREVGSPKVEENVKRSGTPQSMPTHHPYHHLNLLLLLHSSCRHLSVLGNKAKVKSQQPRAMT